MKINIKQNIGDNFFALINGKIYKATISKIEAIDQIYNFPIYIRGDLKQKERTISYQYKYYNDATNSWIKENTQNPKIFHKTKKDAALSLLNEAGFEPGLKGLI